jgi:hypothetical protein
MDWHTHRLLAHLALVDIARRLVVVREGNEVGREGERRRGVDFLMDGDAWLNLVVANRNRQVDLLEWA